MNEIPKEAMKKHFFFVLILLFSADVFAQANFTKQEINIIEQASTKGKFNILLTSNSKDSIILRSRAEEVDAKSKEIPKLYQLMLNTVQDTANAGVGLAAPQIGILKRIFVIQRFDKLNEPFQFMLNPRINWASNLIQNGREGCLSIPDTMGMVDRHYALNITYQNTDAEWITETIEGFTAVIFQHEFDHLDGKLFLDRIQEQQQKQYHSNEQTFKYINDKNRR